MENKNSAFPLINNLRLESHPVRTTGPDVRAVCEFSEQAEHTLSSAAGEQKPDKGGRHEEGS